MFGFEAGELTGAPARLLYLNDQSYESLGREAYAVLASGQTHRAQLQMRKKDGSPIWIEVSGVLLSPQSGDSLWMMRDITQQKQYQTHVETIAFHDALTGLPNRVLLTDRISQTLLLCERLQSGCALCFVDLDGFKAVNDERGHDACDTLLREIARRLQINVRGSDTAARLGGDEFVLLLFPIGNRDACDEILQRVLTSISEPVVLHPGAEARVTASIGVALHPAMIGSADQLMSFADQAMYSAKRAGKNRVHYGHRQGQ